jgi:hypothetical protein
LRKKKCGFCRPDSPPPGGGTAATGHIDDVTLIYRKETVWCEICIKSHGRFSPTDDSYHDDDDENVKQPFAKTGAGPKKNVGATIMVTVSVFRFSYDIGATASRSSRCACLCLRTPPWVGEANKENENGLFCVRLHSAREKRSFYQDRLGTNTGKNSKTTRFLRRCETQPWCVRRARLFR